MKLRPISTLAAAEATYDFTGDSDPSDQPWNDPWLDAAAGPMLKGGLYLFAARTGVGKSMSLLRQHLLLAQGRCPSLYISLEDPEREVGRRVTAAPFPASVKERVSFYVPASPRLSEILAVMEAIPARVVGIDYLQIIQEDTGLNTFDRAGQVRNILSALKSAARANGQSILMAAQLRRPPQSSARQDDTFGPSDQPNPEPRACLFDIRDSSDAENQAEMVILIHRLGRTKCDQTVEKCKSRMGGERRTFLRGKGGWLHEA